MKRPVKVAFYGASSVSIASVKKQIDVTKVDIVAFLDKDVDCCFIKLDDIPIFPVNEFDFTSVDYIIIAKMNEISDTIKILKDSDANPEQIKVLVINELCNYWINSPVSRNLFLYPDNIFFDIYNEPEYLMGVIDKYIKLHENYSKCTFLEDKDDGWYLKGDLISHACGGIVKGHREMYSNSLEALEYTVNNGFKIMECDVIEKSDKTLSLAHDFSQLWDVKNNIYTPMTLKFMFEKIINIPQLHVLLDIKWRTADDYRRIVSSIENILHEITKTENEYISLKKRIILEVYNEETIKCTVENNFECFYTQYKNPLFKCLMETALMCQKYGIKTVGFDIERALILDKRMETLTHLGIHIYCYSTDSPETFSALKKIGVKGIFTNFLIPMAR